MIKKKGFTLLEVIIVL
ncbi:TPA: type II secretion system protein, partial [Escherichia coli]|nr:type II secretion system protein [Escherichia coli]HAN6394882.1 type II secretion system protein [Escherichia coli]HAO1292026.1 type II secretion system protein [Escherichia coli]HAW5741784.1 type II secretion system protein [Escherichia coli]HAX3392642.1 type II secretion system protein [Escherichia coli]